MTPTPILHRVPRFPHGWLLALLACFAVGILVAWSLGPLAGVAVLLLLPLPFVWATLRPDSPAFSPVLRRLPIGDRRVWLTIDDGPSDDTPAVLDLLDAHGATATFFVVGARARRHPGHVREMLRRGHAIGNHSDTHPASTFWRLSPRRMGAEIDRAQASLAQITGMPPRWFRAVVGMANPFVAVALRRNGLARVAWSARGFDGRVADPVRVVARVRRQLSPGAIVLAHEGARHGHSLEILRALLAMLDDEGYRTVLPESLEAGGSERPTAHGAH